MLIRGCLRVVVAMLPNVSCGEGGMNTAAAIHMAVDYYRGTWVLWEGLQPANAEVRNATRDFSGGGWIWPNSEP